MSEQSSEQSPERDERDGPLTVPDEELPEDLRPGEDNPLAQPAGDEDAERDPVGDHES